MNPDPRSEALHVLNILNHGRQTLDTLMETVFEKNALITGRDKAFLNTLVFGVLRWQKRLDWIIGQYSKTPIEKIDAGVLNILRLGLFQMLWLDRVPVSAAVNTSVEMAKAISPQWVVRFVNAVLRNVSRSYDALSWPDPDIDPVKALSVTKSFPEWLIQRWLTRFGRDETNEMCDAINEIPPITLRTNRLKTTRETLIALLESDVDTIEPTRYAPDGIRIYKPRAPIAELNPFKKGYFQVQDEAAQLVGCLLNPRPEETVLDACAGRGGKTGHIAQLMKNRGQITALDRDGKKLKQIGLAMQRLGVSIVTPLDHDLSHPFPPELVKGYDRILIDAPCSGMGVIRRNPDTRWLTSKKNFKRYQKQQITILENLAPLVKACGVMVYAVCSTEPEENEAVVETFLNRHPGFAVDSPSVELSSNCMVLLDQNGYLKTWPHRHDTDGFFAVRLKRNK